MRIVGVVFVHATDEVSIGEIGEMAGVSQATVSKEILRLEEHGLVRSRKIGRTKLVSPNWDLPWAPELRSILMQTVGVLGQLGFALSTVDGVEEAFIFGSWAARYLGEVGHQPADIDVLVIGQAELGAVRAASRQVQADLRVEVNPIVVDRARWEGNDDPFLEQVRSGPLVPIALEASSRG